MADFSGIQNVLFDFDGVMTDNRVSVHAYSSEPHVFVNRSDGLGVNLLKERDIYVALITSERGGPAWKRAEWLSMDIYSASEYGGKADVMELLELDKETTVFVGNDVNDLDVIPFVRLFVAVADAHPKVLAVANYVTSKPGGYGAVREVCDLILEARDEVSS